MARADREGLLPLLFADAALPPDIAMALEGRRAALRVHELRVVAIRQAARRLAQALASEDFVFLKGCDYAWRIYARPELRPMRDVDVFVPPDRIDVVTARLQAAGLPQSFPAGRAARLSSHYERVFDFGPVRLDVHQAFLPPFRLRIDYAEVFRRRVAFDGPCLAFRLSDLDALVHHAVAMAKDELAVPVNRYVDLWLMLRREPSAVGSAIELARRWRAERCLYGALRGLRRFFPEAEELVSERDLARLLDSRARRFLDRRVLPPLGAVREDSRFPRAMQLWRKFWLIPSYPRRAAFAFSHAAAVTRAAILTRRTP